MANLLMHCGGQQVSRDQLPEAVTPERTQTWVPIAHHGLMDSVESTIDVQGFEITNLAHSIWGHGIWGDSARYFGLMELSTAFDTGEDYSLVVGQSSPD